MGRREVLSQHEIEGMIRDDLAMLEEATDAYGDLLEREAKAENEYKRVFNSAYWAYGDKGGHDIRRQFAETEAQVEREDFRTVQALVAAQKETLWTIRGRIDAVRSLNANVRAQV